MNNFRYKKPIDVRTPKSDIKNVKVLCDNGPLSYSIAVITWWDGNESLAMRWNVSNKEQEDSRKKSGELECVGFPQSHGYSSWFVIPDEWRVMIEEEIRK